MIRSSPLFYEQSRELAEASGRLRICKEDVSVLSKKVAELQGKVEAGQRSLKDLGEGEAGRWKAEVDRAVGAR